MISIPGMFDARSCHLTTTIPTILCSRQMVGAENLEMTCADPSNLERRAGY